MTKPMSSMEKGPTSPGHKYHGPKSVRRAITGIILSGTVLVSGGVVLASSGQGIIDNVRDFIELGRYTSAKGQPKRIITQNGLDAQRAFQEYVAGDEDGVPGPLTDAQAEGYASAMGSTPDVVRGILTDEIETPGQDAETPVASSAYVIKGAALSVAGIGLIAGGSGVGLALWSSGRRRRKEFVDGAAGNATDESLQLTLPVEIDEMSPLHLGPDVVTPEPLRPIDSTHMGQWDGF